MASSYFSIAAILIRILFATHLNFCIASRKILSSETDTEFIKTSCGATSYPDLCFTTFSSYASEIQASPKILASKSLSLTLNTTLSASKFLTELSKSQDLEPREAAALQDCVEEISDSVDELKRSIGEMDEIEGKSFAFRMSDIETWVSAALTDQDTCMDGFSENATDGDVKATVRSQIEKVAHMTSIALAFVNRYAGTKN
ncbi:21 kDa protein-like [Herrania umbratica]|uniref:21 kDa protein-like n=1 Tax=Herrania umbratica TaxID=108875 RepID=A0A6J1B776_9ROSI|nr:21 kDa protein-like [Herrania umbratica]